MTASQQPTEALLGNAAPIVALRGQILRLAAFDTVGNPRVPRDSAATSSSSRIIGSSPSSAVGEAECVADGEQTGQWLCSAMQGPGRC